MSRRSGIKQDILKVKVSEILNNYPVINIDNDGIVIDVDICCENANDIAKIIRFILAKNKKNIFLKNCSQNLYLYLVRLSKNYNFNLSVEFNSEKYTVGEMYSILDSSSNLVINEDDIINNLFNINLDDLYKVKLITQSLTAGTELSLKEIVSALDYIAKQVSNYAENDLQKVLLVDKMLRENTEYDHEYYNNHHYYDSLGFHKAHKLETIFTERVVVCNVYSLFADWLFKHPLLKSVEMKEVHGDCCGEGHAWNEVKLNGRWYTQDFTHNVWYDKQNGIKYTLKQKTWSSLQKSDDSGFDYLNTMPAEVIKMEYEKIKGVHVKFPTLEQIKTGNYNISTRRTIEPTTIPNASTGRNENDFIVITRRRVPNKRRKAIIN